MMGRRIAVLAATLVPRLVIGYLTFGSVDAIANFRNTLRILAGLAIDAPYLSSLELWLWISSVIAFYTDVPLIFPFKLLPIACDALIAILLFDSNPDRRSGFRTAMLFAIAPVSIIISAIHPQWDSIWMSFLLLALILVRLQKPSADAGAGVALVLSVIMKPIAAPLALVLLPLTKRRAAAFIGGGAIAVAVYLAILAATGLFPTVREDVLGIIHYASGGVRLFGLPYRPFDRFWMTLAILGILLALYFAKRITRDEVALLFLTGAIGVSGLSPQYLCWVVPFALLCERTRFLALYSLAAGIFLIFYYQMPIVNLPNAENLGTLGMIHPFGAFSPPLPDPRLRPPLLVLGNLVIPLLCLALVAWRIVWVFVKDERAADVQSPPPAMRYLLPAIVLLAGIGAATIWATLQPPLDPDAYVMRVEEKVRDYDVVRYRGPTMMRPGSKIWVARSLLEPGVANPVLNIRTVGIAWVLVAAAVTATWRRPQK